MPHPLRDAARRCDFTRHLTWGGGRLGVTTAIRAVAGGQAALAHARPPGLQLRSLRAGNDESVVVVPLS
jgi:hypothetical protein